MRFDLLKSALALAIMLILITAPTSAVKFAAAAGNGAGASSVSGEYKLQNSASLESDITLGDGVVSRLSSAHGNGENEISEGVSSGDSSVTNTIASDASISYNSNDFGCGAGAVSDYKTSLAGSSGSIYTVATGKENEMTVAGGFSGEGDMDVSLTSLAGQEALTTGSASAVGTACFSNELTEGIRGQDMEVRVHGLYLAGDKGLGEFGVVAQNAKANPAAKTKPPAATYKLAGWKWPSVGTGPNIPIVLSTDLLPADKDSVTAQVSAAQNEWDGYTNQQLFAPLDIVTSDPLDEENYDVYNQVYSKYGTRDYHNVHLWTADTSMSSNTIAMTVTWYSRATKTAVESDCWYNNRLAWRIESLETVGSGTGTYVFDIQTIALHELGHTLGLADLYEDSNKEQTMYGYNNGKSDWTLNSGDIAGIQTLYGA